MPAVTNIPGLPAATSVDGAEELWAVQNGRDVRLTADQIASLGGGGGSGNIPSNLTPVNGVVIANGTNQVSVTNPGIAGQVLTSNGAGVPPSMQPAPAGTVVGGGTGRNNLIPAGGLLVANGVNPVNITDPGTAGQVLTSNGAGVPPTMQNAAASSGTVPNGGTGRATLAAHGILIGEGVSPVNVTTPGTAGQVLTSNGASADPTFQAIPSPVIDAPHGGTGVTSLLAHGLLVGNGVGTVVVTSPGTAGQVLTSNGASSDPTMQTLNVTVPQGGTGVTTLAAHGVVIGEGASAVVVVTPGAAGQVLTSNGAAADPTFQAVPIPNINVAHGGTGVATLAAHGVLIGEGTSPIAVVAPSAIGQVLTSNGSSVDPVWALPGEGTSPDLATWLQAHVDAAVASGTSHSADWIWGDISLPAAVTINITGHLNGFRFDGHGATFTAGFTDTTKDLIKFIVPDANTASVNGLSIANMTLNGTGSGVIRKVKNNLVLSCKLGQSAIFGFGIDRVNLIGANETGVLLYGNVFEGDLISLMARDNDRAGAEFRNPTFAAGSGIISSIKIIGGDYRTNKYGIMTSAETTYQEPGGIHVTDVDFIANSSAGIFAFAGMASITGCHLENNCNNNAGETEGAIFNTFGPIKVDACDATASNSVPQNYLVDFLGQAGQPCYISRSYCQNTDTGVARQIAKLAGNGTLWIDPSIPISSINNTTGGTGWPGAGWSVINSAAAMRTNTQTGATYTVVDNDTHIIANRAGTITLTLPAATNYLNRAIKVRTIQNQTVVSASSNVVPLIGGAAGTAILAATAGKWAELVSDGTNWQIMAGN